MLKKTVLHCGAGLCFGLVVMPTIAQQLYPNKPITVIVPTAPGSSTDREGRVIMSKASDGLGQPVVFDYKVGGSSLIGLNYVAQSVPDGYTLLLASSGISLLPLIGAQLPFDGLNAFAPVSLLSKRWCVIAINASLPVSNAVEFVAYAKAHPGAINFGTSGAGKAQHLAGTLIQSLTGAQFTFIHYKGAPIALVDLAAGRIQAMAMALASAMPQVKSGKLKLLGLSNLTRNPELPDLPTLDEQGWKGYEYVSWLGMVAPAKTPASIVNRMSVELAKAVRSPDLVKRMSVDTNLVGSTPEEFRRSIGAETETYRRLMKENNIELQME